jgi:hypothetical protein
MKGREKAGRKGGRDEGMKGGRGEVAMNTELKLGAVHL